MEVLHQQNEKDGLFYIEKDGEKIAELTYRNQGDDRMIMDHTEVDDQLKGTGAGLKLLDVAVAYAREKGLKMVPLCPYIKHQLEKAPEKYADVVA